MNPFRYTWTIKAVIDGFKGVDQPCGKMKQFNQAINPMDILGVI